MTPEQKQRLYDFAKYLRTVPQLEFDMTLYDAHDNVPSQRVCGTVGCAVGHLPDFGFQPLPKEGWEDLADRAFGLDITPLFRRGSWDWCFMQDWADFDNTPIGAAQRIEWFLANGMPDGFCGAWTESFPELSRFVELYRTIDEPYRPKRNVTYHRTDSRGPSLIISITTNKVR